MKDTKITLEMLSKDYLICCKYVNTSIHYDV